MIYLQTTIKIFEMKTTTITNDYEAPALLTIECSVEAGFSASHIGDNEGYEIPDFENENEL